jgi:DNA-binding NarL/FixJ family response regulator
VQGGTGDSDADLLRAAVEEMRQSAQFPVTFGGIAHRGSVTITHLSGNRHDSLVGLRVETNRGLGGRAMSEGRPRVTSDYGASPHITHDYDEAVLGEGIRSLLAVPVVVRGQTRGVLYGGTHAGSARGGVVVAPAMQIAQNLAIELAVRDEVEQRLRTLRQKIDDSAPRLGAAELADLREGAAELRGIASAVSHDPELRTRVAAVEARLAALARPTGTASSVTLAPRELDVLSYVALGASNAETATRLGLAETTVKAYLSSAMTKLGSRSRFHAVQRARQEGLLP